jgi:hypothetical protein
MTAIIQDILDLDRYPLDKLISERGLDVVKQAHNQLLKTGIVALPGFVRPHATRQMADESLGRLDNTFFGSVEHNIYQEEEDDPAFEPDHPHNRKQLSEC